MTGSSRDENEHAGHDHDHGIAPGSGAAPDAHHDHGHDHGQDHDHDHTPKVSASNERTVLTAFFVTFSFMLVEVAGGLLSGSLALLADAGHMLTDAAALALSWAAFRFGRRAADERRSFGYLRFEVLAGFLNALTLFGIAGWVVYEAWRRFQEPSEVLAGPMFGVAIIGLLVNIFVLWLLQRGDTSHVNIRGASLHVLGDLLGSVGAIAAAAIIWLTGWSPIDPILSVAVCLLIFRSAWSLLMRSTHILLEGSPEHATPAMVERHLLEAVPGLVRVRHIHVWEITSGRVLATLHVLPAAGSDPRALVARIEDELREKFEIEHATVALDWGDDDALSCAFGAPAGAGHTDVDCADA